MGWTEYYATHLYQNGTINRKAECDAYFLESLNRGHYKVVKSIMKGSVYYGAITPLKRVAKDEFGNEVRDAKGWYVYEDIPEEEQDIVAVVVLTYTRGNNFGYKIIGETSGPTRCDCPLSIINLLTPTDNEWANEWRDKCRANALKPNISKLPIGTEIKFTTNGSEVILRKSPPRFQFKTPFWINDALCKYYPKKHIPKDFTVITLGKSTT